VAPIIEAGRAEWAEDGFEVAHGLVLRACPGHTPGSMMLEAAGKHDTALFVGDVVHHPAQIYQPEWNSIFCEAPDQARETRRRVLDMAAACGAVLIPAHFGGSHMARVLREGSGFRPVLGDAGLR
jgi:glyoxylase-like metal-dependent hydrolase (beta-lactamase superfamily II)